MLQCGPSSWGYGLVPFGLTPQVGVIDFHASVWLLKQFSPTLGYDSSSWGYGVRGFGLASRLWVTDSHASVWPLKLGFWTATLRCGFRSGSWTPTLQCGPSGLGHGLPRFSVTPQVGVLDSHASACLLQLGSRSPALRCDPSKLGFWTPMLRCDSSR